MTSGVVGTGDGAAGLDEALLWDGALPLVHRYAQRVGVARADVHQAPIQRFRHSVVLPFEFRSADGPAGIVVKVHRGSRSRTAAETEYHNLCALYRHFRDRSDCRIPRPIGVLPELGAVAMERVVGTRLDVIIRRESRRWRLAPPTRSIEQCARAARWMAQLAAFALHLDGGVPDSRGYRRCWRADLSEMTARATAAGLSGQAAGLILQVLAMPEVHQPDAMGNIHSDFAPYNVLAGRDGLYVVDFAEMPVGLALHCVGFFWSALELAKIHPTASAVALTACQRSFEEAWGETVPEFWKAWGLLRHLSYFPPRTTWYGDRHAVGQRWRVRVMERWLMRAVESLG